MNTSKSLLWSLALHAIFFGVLFVSFAHKIKPSITVNLMRDANPNNRMIKAGVIDKRAVDQVAARQRIQAEAKKQQEIRKQQEILKLAQEQKLAREQKEAEKIAKQQKLLQEQKILQERKVAAQKKIIEQKKLAEQKILHDKKVAEQNLAKQQKHDKAQQLAQEQKLQQEKKAMGLKAERDLLRAQQDAFIASELEKYKAEISTIITENRIVSSIFASNLHCLIRIKLLPDGSILSVSLEKSSGNAAYDEMSMTAIYKSAPFHMPENKDLYEGLRDIVLSFKNEGQANEIL